VSIPASNYVEKARWALQLAKIPFVEVKHMPIFHRSSTKPLGGRSVPLLSLPDSKIVLRNSSEILDFCAKSEPSLYPNDGVKQRELYYDKEFGPATRVVGKTTKPSLSCHW
jgi:glutathione S-transferase